MSSTTDSWHEAADTALSAKHGKTDPDSLDQLSRSLFENLTIGELEEMKNLSLVPPNLH